MEFKNGQSPFKKPKSFVEKIKDFFLPKQPEIISPLSGKDTLSSPEYIAPTPTSTPTPTPVPLFDRFKKGFEGYGSDLATASAQFAQSAKDNPLPDPFLPAVLSFMETSGGKKQKFANNPFNWGMQDMPSLEYAIDRIYSGIAKRFPYYKDYLKTGDLRDFFKRYTPEGPSNPTPDELIERYGSLRKRFD